MFIGQYNNNMDVKKRLTFPAKLRAQIEGNVVLTRGLDGCLSVYTIDAWEQVANKLAALPTTKVQARAYARMVLSNAAEIEFDKNGRINIPNHLCELAKLSKSCIIIGAGNHMEIWDETRWLEYNESLEESFDDLASELIDFEI
ncbi:division/cell wall cluster transcriptional repressor MraZ [Mycoplasma sp. P36-A1]|uniref:division/cell wall cluster transcriptional repressor MraZ n=1 Tax=Mycoplasma sp. P36-A1 TaxID=3252900 RepID=UPI003C2C40FF